MNEPNDSDLWEPASSEISSHEQPGKGTRLFGIWRVPVPLQSDGLSFVLFRNIGIDPRCEFVRPNSEYAARWLGEKVRSVVPVLI